MCQQVRLKLELQSPYFKIFLLGAQDLIRKLLKKKPDERLSLDQVMKHFWITEMMSNK